MAHRAFSDGASESGSLACTAGRIAAKLGASHPSIIDDLPDRGTIPHRQ